MSKIYQVTSVTTVDGELSTLMICFNKRKATLFIQDYVSDCDAILSLNQWESTTGRFERVIYKQHINPSYWSNGRD